MRFVRDQYRTRLTGPSSAFASDQTKSGAHGLHRGRLGEHNARNTTQPTRHSVRPKSTRKAGVVVVSFSSAPPGPLAPLSTLLSLRTHCVRPCPPSTFVCSRPSSPQKRYNAPQRVYQSLVFTRILRTCIPWGGNRPLVLCSLRPILLASTAWLLLQRVACCFHYLLRGAQATILAVEVVDTPFQTVTVAHTST
jgi:hypothetical protein